MLTKNRYTLEAGRVIVKEGRPFVALQRMNETSPVEADDFTREIVRAVNSHALLLEACKLAFERLKPSGDVRKDYAGHVAIAALSNAIAKTEEK